MKSLAVLLVVLVMGSVSAHAESVFRNAVPSNSHDTSSFYPVEARRALIEGDVYVEFTIGADGRVSQPDIRTSSNYPELDQAALDAVQTWTYLPATRDGVPVAVRKWAEIRFRLAESDSLFGNGDLNAFDCHGHPNQSPAVRKDACERLLATSGLSDEDRNRAICFHGGALAGLGRYDDGLAELNSVLAKVPDDAMFIQTRAAIFYMKGDYMRAKADFDRARGLAPDRLLLEQDSAVTDMRLGNYVQAITKLDVVLARLPLDARARFTRGMAHYKLHHYDLAMVDANWLIQHVFGNQIGIYLRGLIERATGDAKQGDADVSAATAADPNVAENSLQLAETP